jgi:peptidoglycan/xylan/chitin deacetylase (PgdA/CDA1 family)
MLRSAMSRFHKVLISALLLGILAVVAGKIIFFLVVIGAFVVLTGLGVAFPQMRFFGPFICRGDTSRRRVALTFDDGPDARSTPALLDLLREAQVPAAFFCIGKKVTAERKLTARISGEGHLLGNHTFNHSYGTNFFTVARLQAEITQTQKAIQEARGTVSQFFRPPVGLSNPRTFRAAAALGFKVIGWSARSLDTRITDPERIVKRILRRLEPGGIILLHDGNIPAAQLAATVKLLLAKLHERGYAVVRLDELLK